MSGLLVLQYRARSASQSSCAELARYDSLVSVMERYQILDGDQGVDLQAFPDTQ